MVSRLRRVGLVHPSEGKLTSRNDSTQTIEQLADVRALKDSVKEVYIPLEVIKCVAPARALAPFLTADPEIGIAVP